jgi:thioredoxin-like negative regulator of GroEL
MEHLNNTDRSSEAQEFSNKNMQSTSNSLATAQKEQNIAEKTPEPVEKKKRRRRRGKRGKGKSQKSSDQVNDQIEDIQQISEQETLVPAEQGTAGTQGETSEAELIEQIITTFSQRKSSTDVPYTLIEILAWTQQWERVEEVIGSIKSSGKMYQARCIYVYELLYFMHNEQAMSIINNIKSSLSKKRFLITLSYLVQAKKWETRAKHFEDIKNAPSQDELLRLCKEQSLQKEHIDKARKQAIYTLLGNPEDHGFCFLAKALLRAKRLEQARYIIQAIPDQQQKSSMYLLLEEAFEQSAEATFQRIRHILEQRVESSEGISRDQQIEQALHVAKEISNMLQRSEALLFLGKVLIKERQWEQAQLVIEDIPLLGKRDQALLLLKQALSQVQEWTRAITAVYHIKDSYLRDRSLRILSARLVWAQQWDLAEQVVHAIQDSRQRTIAAIRLGEGLEMSHEYQRLLHLIQQAWCRAETREEAIELLRLAQGLLLQQPDIGFEFGQTFKLVDDFLLGKSNDAQE